MRFDNYNHLGFHNPYYIYKQNQIQLFETFQKGISKLDEQILDISSVIEILNRGYIFGDKTLVRGLKKTPWMARPNENNTD